MNLRAIITNLVLAVVYGVAGGATLAFAHTVGLNLSSVLWIPAGIALAVALQVPFPVWPGVALGAAAATLSDGAPLPHGIATALTNGGEIALAMFLLRKAGFNRRFGTARDVLLLVGLACGVSAALAALASVTSLVMTGLAPASEFGRIWPMWWLTHGMGMLLVVPPTLIVRATPTESTRETLAEAAILLPAIAATAWIAFMAPAGSLLSQLFFLPFPLLLLGAVRGDALVAMFGGLLVTVVAIAAALVLRGPFSFGSPNQALFLTWSFAAVTIIATVIASAVVKERTLAQQEVESGERRLRAVLEATSEGILVADDLGRVTDVNSAFLGLIGGGEGVSESAPAQYAGVDVFLDRLRPSVDGGTAPDPEVLNPGIGPGRKAWKELMLPDGRVVEAESVPLAGPVERGGRVWSVRDVTQRVASEAERHRLHEQILHGQKLEGLGVLAGGVAHDFNNVLAGIMGYAELLLSQPGLDDEGRSDVEGIIKASQHAAGLCRQLLTYAGKTTAMLGPVDLSECARDMRQFMAMSVGKSVEFELDVPDHSVTAMADEVQLRQVIFNLVTNASEAILARPGNGRVLVRVGSRFLDQGWLARAFGAEGLREGTYAVVEVEDDGIGMDASGVTQIFDPFYSSKGAGRGLGLSAVLGVLRSHQGALAVETQAGLGTRFQIALPQSERRHEIEEVMPPRQAPTEGQATILVVDDEAVVRETIARIIGRDGHKVLQAEDGDFALAILAELHREVDLIVLDLTMPNRDGLSTLAEMRERGYRIPVLLASGYSNEAVPPDASVAGFIQKPFRSADLRERVASVLSEGAPRRV